MVKAKTIITKTWKGNGSGTVLIAIPKKMAEFCNLTPEVYVKTTVSDNGLIEIEKLDLEVTTK